MKVLYVLRYWPTLTETFVYREIAGLLRRGVEVEVLGIDARQDGSLQDELPPVVVHRPPRGVGTAAGGAAWLSEGCPRWGLRRKDAVRASWAGSLARQRGVTRIHAHFAGEPAAWAAIAARVAGVPFSVTVHASDLYRRDLSSEDIEVLGLAAPLVTISEYNQRYLAEHHGLSARLVRTGLPDRAARTPVRGATTPMRVVSIGRWVPKKGLDLLLRALEITGLPARIVSEIPDEWAVEGVVAGALPPSAVEGVLADADVFVLPCRIAPDGDRDGIPVVLLEAMAAGLPVITTPVSGIPELVDESVGWLIPPDDVDALVSCLRAVEQQPDLLEAKGRAGRNRVCRDWTLDGQLERLTQLWEGPCEPL